MPIRQITYTADDLMKMAIEQAAKDLHVDVQSDQIVASVSVSKGDPGDPRDSGPSVSIACTVQRRRHHPSDDGR